MADEQFKRQQQAAAGRELQERVHGALREGVVREDAPEYYGQGTRP